MSMFPIATQTVTGSAAQLTFNNIPQNFSHLQIRIFGRLAATGSIINSFIQVNSFGGTYPNYHYLSSDGASVTSGSSTSSIIPLSPLPAASATANYVGSLIVDILDYSNTNKYKTIKSIGGTDLNGSGVVQMATGSYASTSAVTNFIVGGAFTAPYTFAVGTRVDLYGISTSSVTGA